MPRKTATGACSPTGTYACFNEAAARCRGKPGSKSPRDAPAPAGFNEAAARCRGKRLPAGTARTDRPRRFNEAAARCRGKLRRSALSTCLKYGASMRPRPDAAENKRWHERCVAAEEASMRPRPDAAENDSAPAAGSRCTASFNEAAARCRGKRASSPSAPFPGPCFNEAAARCRGKRRSSRRASRRARPSFNEAAARCRGKPVGRRWWSGIARSFNEAAARCRGKPAQNNRATITASSFNEAAARCRGKLRHGPSTCRGPCASMRPRPDAAENGR